MADAKTTTLTIEMNDGLSEVQAQIEFIHTFTGLLLNQPDFEKLPAHVQIAIDALLRFASAADQKLQEVRHY